MEIVYNIVAYKSKVIHVEYDTLNVYPIRNKINAYPMEWNNCVDYSITIL